MCIGMVIHRSLLLGMEPAPAVNRVGGRKPVDRPVTGATGTRNVRQARPHSKDVRHGRKNAAVAAAVRSC